MTPRAVVVRGKRGRLRAAIAVGVEPESGIVQLFGDRFTDTPVTLDAIVAARALDPRFGIFSPESRGNALALLEKVRRLRAAGRTDAEITETVTKGDLR